VDTYDYMKVLHVAFVVIWVGGDFSFLIFSIKADLRSDVGALESLIPNVLFFAKYVATPTSLGALVCGLVMAWLSWGFEQLWILIGLAGLAAVAVNGVAGLRPRSERLLATMKTESKGIVLHRFREILRMAKFDHVVLFVVIAAMVLKPGFDDVATWGVMAVIVVAAALLFLMPRATPLVPA
jgi:Predicted integral membrane protein (DUF2269)